MTAASILAVTSPILFDGLHYLEVIDLHNNFPNLGIASLGCFLAGISYQAFKFLTAVDVDDIESIEFVCDEMGNLNSKKCIN